MRVVLVCHGVTEAVRDARFGGDDPLTPAGLAAAESLVAPRVDRLLSAPSTACRQTAAALGPSVEVDRRLAGCDYGRWTGLASAGIASAEPDALGRWLTDPEAAPHGGETVAALVARIGGWLDDRVPGPGAVLAVVDAMVLRAALAHAVDSGPRSVWRFDVAPLGRAVLTGGPGRWSLRELVGTRAGTESTENTQ